jgi:pSer/pThr/pTyr-binding forkhead associated (FHA) protein/RNA polymerase subunit RPABC4/transcription elongation factor Spt4
MDQGVGIACGACDTFNPMGAKFCTACGTNLSFVAAYGSVAPAAADSRLPVSDNQDRRAALAVDNRPLSELSQEELMEQARNYVCKQCSTPVPSGHKFCGACGGTVPVEIQNLQTDYFGAMQAPGKARLILIRGDQGVDGLSYLLQGMEHVAGRQDAQILFPDDAWLSPTHANFIYRGEKLVVRDEGSVNGVYVRVRGSVPLRPSDHFLCGEQVFRLESTPKDTSGPDPDQTYFYSSPKRPSPFRVVQVLRGGADGMVHCARDKTVAVGREESDMNFPDDVYMSANHAAVAMEGSAFSLTDAGSKNGTYVRVSGEYELSHGDYVFLGKQLLRVEMTA